MLAGILILLVVSGSAFQALVYYQKNYLATQLRVDMHAALRSSIELLTQEIGQAGLLTFTPRTISGNYTGNPSAQPVTLNDATDIFVGEKLLIDAGASQELVTVTAKSGNVVSGIFTKNHSDGATVNALGIFPQGIMPSPSISTATSLKLFGDLYGDGTLVYAQYDCNTGAGTFSRSVTPVSAGSINASQVLIANITANPGGTPCFQYTTVSKSGYIFVTSVGITLTVRTAQRDPQTNQYATMTKTFLNIAPRNVLAGLENANGGIIGRLQPTPPNLPLS